MGVNNTYDLSVVIVNYNVEYFLEQCLNSVLKAGQKSNIEILKMSINKVNK